MRRIAVVTVGRSDFGIYLPILRAIQADPELDLTVIASGAHLSPSFGWTVNDITAQGFEIAERVDMLLAADTPEGVAKSMGLGVLGFAQAYSRLRPDILLVLGDRFEMHAAALAAVPLRIPIAHVHGGEVTIGAIDDAFRHAMTKYAHLHFASTQEHVNRIVQLGEQPWRVTLSGAPSLDNLKHMQWLSDAELTQITRLPLDPAPVMVTYHPVTVQHEQAEWQIHQLVAALEESSLPVVFSAPNADTNYRVILSCIEAFARRSDRVQVVDNLGTRAYFSLMRRARGMVGNSSSGILEAASFELPVVNVGIRQSGRPRSRNVIDVGNDSREIAAGMRLAFSTEFRTSLRGLRNVYGAGQAASAIVARLKNVTLDESLLVKQFHDVHWEAQPCSPIAA